MPSTSFPAMTPVVPVTTEDKTVAIVSYLTLIGFIVAVVLHGSKKTQLGAYHLRQSLGLILTSVAVGFALTVLPRIPYLGPLLGSALWIGLFVLWIMGFIAAASGQLKPVPVLGQKFEAWFGGMFS